MARYTDLSQPPAQRIRALIDRAAEAGRQQATAPHGVVDLGSGDQVWVDETGAHSVRELPPAIVESSQAADAAAAAALGAQNTADTANQRVTTLTGAMTIAAANPTTADATGKPLNSVWEVRAGGITLRRFILTSLSPVTWTQVKLGTDLIGDKAIGTAQIGDAQIGTAQVAELDVTRLRAGAATMDTVAAQKIASTLVTGGLIKTTTSPDGRWLGMSNNGIASYGLDSDGRPSVLSQWSTVSAAANFMSFGRSSIADSGVQAVQGSFDTISLAGQSLADRLDALPKGLIGRYERPAGTMPDRSDWVTLISGSWIAEPGRQYRVITSQLQMVTPTAGGIHVRRLLRGYLANSTIYDFADNETALTGWWSHMEGNNLTLSAADMGVTTATGPKLVTVSEMVLGQGGGLYRLGATHRPMKLTIEDLGKSIATTISGDTWTSGSGTTPNNPIIHDMLYRASSGWTNYGIAGATRPASGSWDGNPANLSEPWFAFPDMTAELAGSTITGVWIRLANHSTYWSSGGSAYVGFHSYGALPGSKPTNLTNLITTGWAPGEYKEIPVSPALFAGIKNGSIKGMGITANGNLGTNWYALWGPQPMFRIAHDHY